MTSTLITRARKLSLACSTLIMLSLLLAALSPRALAQDGSGNQTERQRAMQLFEQSKFTEALPLLEKLAAANPSDVLVMERLGWATLVIAGSMKDAQERQQARERARKALLRAKELGDKSDLLRIGLEQLSNPDPADAAFSGNKEADAAMREGEEAHTRGDLDKAIAAYQRALQLDPKLYMAALFTGDMYFKKGYNESDATAKEALMQKAGEWFARAIAIDPNIETAYRYWGDALMTVNKMTEAKDKYVDAIIAEPYNRNSYAGL
ncbi:MAG TPA: tetratricopeptide repeat protein, partial [Pyrinomonadaceae bacterium]